jgi:heme-degrading monooxygenase HmoA
MIKVVLVHKTKDRDRSKELIKLIDKVRDVAKKQPGFISGETLVNIEDPCTVIVISTWQKEEDWKAWDESPERAVNTPSIQALLVQPFDAFIHPVGIWREDLINTF